MKTDIVKEFEGMMKEAGKWIVIQYKSKNPYDWDVVNGK